MRNHNIEILCHIVFCKDSSVKHEVSCSYSIIKVDVFNLLVKGSPEFSNMTPNENSTAERRTADER